jgi:hypothetical protein
VKMFDYVKIKKRSEEIHKIFRIPPEQGTGWRSSGWHWCSAMEGGPVMTDAQHWRLRHAELAKDVADMRKTIISLNREIRDLKKQLASKEEKRSV